MTRGYAGGEANPEATGGRPKGWPKGKRHTAETKARISQSVRRLHERRRREARVRPAHVDRWVRDHVIPVELRPLVEFRAQQRAQMVEDLGGDLTAMQEAALDNWFGAQIAADALSMIALREGYLTMAADRMPTFLNTARNALALIGLKREARQVPDVTEYLRKAAEDGSGPTDDDA